MNYPSGVNMMDLLGVGPIPVSIRRKWFYHPFGATSNQPYATDSIGSCDIAIENAVIGSRYRIEVASTGALVAEGDVSSASFAVSVPLYPAGNPANSLRVKVRKGTSAPKYQPFQTQVTAVAGGALAYISQVPDPIA
jgi:hypothetical protein